DIAPNAATDATSTALRPQRPDSRPPIAAPSMSPKVAAPKSQPNWSGPRSNAARTRGATTPAACRSYPANTDTAQHSASVSHAVLPAGARTAWPMVPPVVIRRRPATPGSRRPQQLVIVNNLPPGAGAGRGSAGRRMGPPPGA